MPDLAARATNNAYYILTRLSLSPHRTALIEKRQDRACPLCFTQLGIIEVNDQLHNFYNCLTAQFMKKFLYYAWFKFAGIFMNTDIEGYYMLDTKTQIDRKMNGKNGPKYKKYVHMSIICAHLISKNLVNNVKTTSSWSALKRLINYQFRISIKKSIWNKFPPEFFDYDKISLLPKFKQGPPWKEYPIQMTKHLFEKLHPEEERIKKLHQILRHHGLTYDYENSKKQPEMDRLRHLQIRCNQAVALIATELNVSSDQIRTMRNELSIFWAADDY